MPILKSILDNKVLGREFKRGFLQGFADSLRAYCLRTHSRVDKRVGAIPSEFQDHFAVPSDAEIEELALRAFEEYRLKELSEIARAALR